MAERPPIGRSGRRDTGYHSLEFYYSRPSHFFVDARDKTFTRFSCRRGTVDRWTNLPMLHTVAALDAAIVEHSRALLVVHTDQRDRLSPELADLDARVTWTGGWVSIIAVARN